VRANIGSYSASEIGRSSRRWSSCQILGNCEGEREKRRAKTKWKVERRRGEFSLRLFVLHPSPSFSLFAFPFLQRTFMSVSTLRPCVSLISMATTRYVPGSASGQSALYRNERPVRSCFVRSV